MLRLNQIRIIPEPATKDDVKIVMPKPAPFVLEPDPNDWLFGWDPTPGIVSVWADRTGRALIWRRIGQQVVCEHSRYRPWVFARSLDDVTSKDWGAGLYYHRLRGGAAGDYRYMISAPSYLTLERALLTGASRRLGQPVERLTQLKDYYVVGPVEQYLTITGRVYFRGISYSKLHRFQLDLSCTALDPNEGRIFMVAVKDTNGLEMLIEAPTAGGEANLIRELCALIRERDPDVVEGHNLCAFALPYLEVRAKRLGVPLALGRVGGKRGELVREDLPASHYHRARIRYSVVGRELIDTLHAVWRLDATNRNMPGYDLRSAARYFGLGEARSTPIHGHHIYDRFGSHPGRVRSYALDAVRIVDGLSQLLMGASFALAQMTPRSYTKVACAGPAMGILEPMLVRAYYRAWAALPRSADLDNPDLRRSKGGASYLLQGGLAGHIVKADVASMYPSIMRLYNIGPQYDRLGVLVQLVGRMMELRLEHKQRARAATAGSAAASQLQALSAGMKLVIVSAYGYMAAGGMALLADVDAADALTARSSDILDKVISELRKRGVALLEADIDGVYFSVPDYYSEEDERALVAEVAATLPAGIKLEYEARYAAMLSHEIKNYALLSYDGKLIVHGSGLRNSQSPPFAARFLLDALEYLLRDDVGSVVSLYHATVQALRDRQFPAADVAARTRLTKTSAEYQRTRGRLREGPYEALLAAGRISWEAGELVRYYRAKGDRYVWLPFAPDDLNESEGTIISTAGQGARQPEEKQLRDYDVKHYLRLLQESYLSRIRKAFRPEDFKRLFRDNAQGRLYERWATNIYPRWIKATDPEQKG